jgi:hypothetical protein
LIDSTNEIISYVKRPAILSRSGKIFEYIINTTKIKTEIISDLMLIETRNSINESKSSKCLLFFGRFLLV